VLLRARLRGRSGLSVGARAHVEHARCGGGRQRVCALHYQRPACHLTRLEGTVTCAVGAVLARWGRGACICGMHAPLECAVPLTFLLATAW
jgi:hypothetical protein